MASLLLASPCPVRGCSPLLELAIDDGENEEDQHGDDGNRDYPIRSHPSIRVSTGCR